MAAHQVLGSFGALLSSWQSHFFPLHPSHPDPSSVWATLHAGTPSHSSSTAPVSPSLQVCEESTDSS